MGSRNQILEFGSRKVRLWCLLSFGFWLLSATPALASNIRPEGNSEDRIPNITKRLAAHDDKLADLDKRLAVIEAENKKLRHDLEAVKAHPIRIVP